MCVCVKERDIMETQKIERQRLKPGHGEQAFQGGCVLYLYLYLLIAKVSGNVPTTKCQA